MTYQERQPVETEEISVNDTPITIERQADDTLTVKLPEGLTDEAKETLRSTIETGEVSNLVKAWHRKNQELNQAKAEWEAIKAKLQEPPETKEQPKQDTKTPDPLWKQLGLESEADLDDYAVDHPAEYSKHIAQDTTRRELAEYQRKLDEQLQTQLTKQKTEFEHKSLIQSITAQGIDPLDIQAFAMSYGMPFSEKAFNLYQQLHRDKSNPVLMAQKEAQTKQINFIEQSHYRQKSNPTESELKSMTDAELNEWIAYAKERTEK